MTIFLVEDDYLQADWICQKLREGIPDADVRLIPTEADFRSHLDQIASQQPDVVVMDVMLRWADPRPELEFPPRDVQEEGFYRAGLRCQRMLAEDSRTSQVPVILYTVLERTDLFRELPNLPQYVQYLAKQSDVSSLIEKIKELTRGQRQDT